MEEEILISPVDQRAIPLTGMSRRELRDLHYTEEIKMAKMILALPPFSKERKQLLNEGYAFVEALKLRYERNINGSFGSTAASVKLVEDIIEQRKQKEKTQIVYEAGVGTGYAVERLAAVSGVKFYGCDVKILPSVREIMRKDTELCIRERTLYEDLAELENNLIDVFYADNVIEHFVPDEIPYIMKRLYKKMKKGGQLIWFIPNKYTGPNDVSRYYLPKGHVASGFHFMEMSYRESLCLAIRNGFKPKWIARKVGNTYYPQKDRFGLKNYKRALHELLICRISNVSVRSELLGTDAFDCYILEK